MKRTRLALTLVVVIAVVSTGCGGSTAEVSVVSISPPDAASIIADDSGVVVLDIRTPAELLEGVIDKNAVNIDFYGPSFAEQLGDLDRDAHYIVYCRSGNRSGQALSTFRDLGFTHVTEIAGGIVAWDQAGLPIVAP